MYENHILYVAKHVPLCSLTALNSRAIISLRSPRVHESFQIIYIDRHLKSSIFLQQTAGYFSNDMYTQKKLYTALFNLKHILVDMYFSNL